MPERARSIDLATAEAALRDGCFIAGERGVGVEVEWITARHDAAGSRPALGALLEAGRAAGPLPRGGAITFEPGGQVEVSSVPRPLGEALDAAVEDADHLRRAFATHGLDLRGAGLDAVRPPRRIVFAPRYDAMEAYFDAFGPHGRTMMCSTAAVQVNLDAGADPVARWRLIERLGPVLAATFANSPRDGFRSARLANWLSMDASRCAPVFSAADPREAWARYALDARVMMIRESADSFVPMREPMRFRDWIASGHRLGFPTKDDLAYHLTTLFPPVRARGWIELRMIDALEDRWWPVAVAVATALVEDGEAADAARRLCAGTSGAWADAARLGVSQPALGAASVACFALAIDAMRRLGAGDAVVADAEEFFERYTLRGLSPADEALTRNAVAAPA